MTSILQTIPYKVLFADDDKDTLEMMRTMALLKGWEAHCVSSAGGIIDEISRECADGGRCFDAVVADINFDNDDGNGPKMTGISAARQIRRAEEDMPIIFVSGYVNNITREEARRVEAEIIKKPIDIDEVFERIEGLIEWHRMTTLEYDGPERRKNSINRSGLQRRRTDPKEVETNFTVRDIVRELRAATEELV